MDVRKIEYFICCAECLNFTHAAKRLHISQQALSKQIQILEVQLGEKVFERSKTSLKLTEVGKKVYDTFQPLIRNLYHGYEEVQEFIKYKQKTIKFAYFSDIPYNEIIAPLMKKMTEINPELRISMLAADIGLDRELLESDSVDFVVSVKTEDDYLWQNMEYSVIRRAPSKIIVSENHPWYEKEQVTVDDIANDRFIVYETCPGCDRDYYLSFIQAKERIPVPNVDTYMGVLAQGQGFGVMSETYSRKEGNYKLLELPDAYAHTMEIIIAYKKFHPLRHIFEQIKEMDI